MMKYISGISCPPLPSIEDGIRGWQVFDFGAGISFQCMPGYEVVGHHYSICQDDNQWSNEAPICRRKVHFVVARFRVQLNLFTTR